MRNLYNKFKKIFPPSKEAPKEKVYKNELLIYLKSNNNPILCLKNTPWDINEADTIKPWRDLYDWFINSDRELFIWKYKNGEYMLVKGNILAWNLRIEEDI